MPDRRALNASFTETLMDMSVTALSSSDALRKTWSCNKSIHVVTAVVQPTLEVEKNAPEFRVRFSPPLQLYMSNSCWPM